MKTYNIKVTNNHHQRYRFHIVAKNIACALVQLQQYIDLTNQTYHLKYIKEKTNV